MIAMHGQASRESVSLITSHAKTEEAISSKVKDIHSTQLFLPNSIITHPPQYGINPLVDAGSYLFSAIGKIRNIKTYRQLSKLQKELIEGINSFQEIIRNSNYNPELLVICRYIFCAVLDDIITHTSWGAQWISYSLLSTFNQDQNHHEKFFSIIDHALKDPVLYIDLLEFIYICLSLGYKGKHRATEYSQYQLEQVTDLLYRTIRNHRGSFSKTLSPKVNKSNQPVIKKDTQNEVSPLLIMIISACIIMIIFVSLAYLMDIFANETSKKFTEINQSSTALIEPI